MAKALFVLYQLQIETSYHTKMLQKLNNKRAFPRAAQYSKKQFVSKLLGLGFLALTYSNGNITFGLLIFLFENKISFSKDVPIGNAFPSRESLHSVNKTTKIDLEQVSNF